MSAVAAGFVALLLVLPLITNGGTDALPKLNGAAGFVPDPVAAGVGAGVLAANALLDRLKGATAGGAEVPKERLAKGFAVRTEHGAAAQTIAFV